MLATGVLQRTTSLADVDLAPMQHVVDFPSMNRQQGLANGVTACVKVSVNDFTWPVLQGGHNLLPSADRLSFTSHPDLGDIPGDEVENLKGEPPRPPRKKNILKYIEALRT